MSCKTKLRIATSVGALVLAFATPLIGGAAAGELTTVSVPSAALGAPIGAVIYTPEGAAPAEGWPVLYLLHGHDGDARSWPDLGDIEATLDRLIEARRIEPLLVVMPDADNGWYVDSKDVGGPGDYETALVRDLPAWIEANHPARTDRSGRAIAGLSMGGYGALRLAFAHPGRYAAVASLSGALWQNVPAEDMDLPPDQLAVIADSAYFHRIDDATVGTGPDVTNLVSHFNGAFGAPFDARRFNAQNVFTLLAQRVAENTALPAPYVTVGDDDGFHLWRGAIALFETMQLDGAPVELRVTDGDHVWSLWKVAIVDALAFVDTHLSAPN